MMYYVRQSLGNTSGPGVLYFWTSFDQVSFNTFSKDVLYTNIFNVMLYKIMI